MTPTFDRGLRGQIALDVQRALGIAADGDYGSGTRAAVLAFQQAQALPQSGVVDAATWTALFPGRAFPDLFERCLNLTARFEGHGYGKAIGNFDGAGLTWGIIGFQMKSNSIKTVLAGVPAAVVAAAMGANRADMLADVCGRSAGERVAWGASLTTNTRTGELDAGWRDAFARLGATPEAQAAQRSVAREQYWRGAQSALSMFAEFAGVDRAAALFFDCHVQSGQVFGSAGAAAHASLVSHPGDVVAALSALANAQANALNPARVTAAIIADVRARKLCIATGKGTVHGGAYDLMAWALPG